MATVTLILIKIKAIILAIVALNTNAAIVGFVVNNLVLLVALYLFIIATPWKWDNFIAKWMKNIIKYIKPDAKIPEDDKK